jgi:hypothetical protein
MVLVCADADAPLVAPGSIFDRSCAMCGRAVMIAPSGQGLLERHPETRILCARCFLTLPDAETATVAMAGTPEEIAQECSAATPNMRRRRN